MAQMLWSADSHINSEYLAWKYENNPYLKDINICLAIHEGEIVGMRGAWGSCWTTGDSSTPSIIPCMGDMVIAPAHRGRGVLRGLNEFMSEHLGRQGFPFLLSLSASRPVYFGSLKVGWKPIVGYNKLERFSKVFWHPKIRKLRNRWMGGTPIAMRRLREVFRPGGPKIISTPDIELRNTARIAAMAQLSHSVGQVKFVGPVRDEDYYAWRLRCPLSQYFFLYAGKLSLDGFIVLQRRPSRPYEINIVDWEATSESVFASLIAAAIEFAGISDMRIWSTSMPPTFVSRLRRNEFSDSEFVERNGYEQSLMIQETKNVESGIKVDDFCERLNADNSCNLRMIISDDY
jgi:hypothetical protein